MDLGEAGRVDIDVETGEVVQRPYFFDVQGRILAGLVGIRTTVEKALVKSSADRFARMAFPEHMHSPVIDLVSWMMLHGELRLNRLQEMVQNEESKYMNYVELLRGVGLVVIENEVIQPTSFFIEIESRPKPLNDRLTDVLSFYFARGYEGIESIHQFVGPQLTITGFVYQASLESGEPVASPYSSIEDTLQDRYRERKKLLQLPRYLAQLEGVDLLARTDFAGERAWVPQADRYQAFIGEEQLLGPVLAMM